MKVPTMEGVANHIVPESCAANREACREALTGALAGQPLSRERYIKAPSADTLLYVEGNTGGRANASTRKARRGLRTWHASMTPARKPGDLLSDRWRQHCHAARIGKAISGQISGASVTRGGTSSLSVTLMTALLAVTSLTMSSDSTGPCQ